MVSDSSDWVDATRKRLSTPAPTASSARGLDNSAGGTNPPDMEARVAKLEETAGRIDITLARMDEKMNSLATKDDIMGTRSEISGIAQRLASIEGAVGKMPTTLQLLGFVLAVLAAAGFMKAFVP
jgi:hypothetical protein